MTRQGGAAVLAAVVVVVMLALLLRLYSESASERQLHYQASQVDSLAFARDALIDYSVNYPSHYADRSAGPGHLPCPDKNGNGSPAFGCSGLLIGFLPVDFGTAENKNISFMDQQQMAGEPLWYVVSRDFRNNPSPNGSPNHNNIVNSDTRGELSLDGESGIIALLIAPGPSMQGQQRGASVAVEDFLEGENADGDLVFASAQGNDRILAIRWTDLMPLVERRVLATARDVIRQYQRDHGHLPWLADSATPMLAGNSHCTPCQWQGWLASNRYYSTRPWPAFSTQSCIDEATSLELEQPTPVLPAWFASNYWHRYVWLHLKADSRGGACAEAAGPVVHGQGVSALLVSVGRALNEPDHGLGPQLGAASAEVHHFLDSDSWIDGDDVYPEFSPAEGLNDQWSVLP